MAILTLGKFVLSKKCVVNFLEICFLIKKHKNLIQTGLADSKQGAMSFLVEKTMFILMLLLQHFLLKTCKGGGT